MSPPATILSGDEEATPPMPEPIDLWNAPDETTKVALHGGPARMTDWKSLTLLRCGTSKSTPSSENHR